jgi:polyhydroxybutyrate depolymerase
MIGEPITMLAMYLRGRLRAYAPSMRRARWDRLAVLLMVLAGACSPVAGDPGGSPAQDSPAGSPIQRDPATLTPVAIAPGVESAGCSGSASPGSRSESFRHDGIERTYDIVVPETERGVAMPVVLSFHGFTDSSVAQARRSGLADRAAADGFIAVFPRGSNVDGTTPPYFNLGTVDDASLADDVGFTMELLDRVEAELCVDRSRIFASGWSNGGMFAATLGCALNDRVAAVASVSGVHLLPDCRGRPMPIIVIHGSADDIVPLSEEDVGSAADVRGFIRSLGGNQAQVRMLAAVDLTPVQSWVESWAERNGCELSDPAVESGIVVDKMAYRNCRPRGDVVLQVVKGGGHDWPPSPASDTTDEVLSFFASHPCPVDELS